jgi:hypothetical protein
VIAGMYVIVSPSDTFERPILTSAHDADLRSNDWFGPVRLISKPEPEPGVYVCLVGGLGIAQNHQQVG